MPPTLCALQKSAQVLLTLDNLANRSQYINARNTFEELLRYGESAAMLRPASWNSCTLGMLCSQRCNPPPSCTTVQMA